MTDVIQSRWAAEPNRRDNCHKKAESEKKVKTLPFLLAPMHAHAGETVGEREERICVCVSGDRHFLVARRGVARQ